MRMVGPRDASADETIVLADIAYEHAVRGLDSQAAVLSEIRTRANYVMVATVAVTSLFAVVLAQRSPLPRGIDIAAAVPLTLLAIGVYLATSVLRPTGKQGQSGKLQLVASAAAILTLNARNAVDARSAVARELETMWDGNQRAIEHLMVKLRRASDCLAAQVACWTMLLVVRQLLS